MANNKNNAVIFDFGNVIAHFDHRRATRRFAQRSAMSESAMFAAIYDGPLEHAFESGRIGVDAFVARVIDTIGYRGTRDQFTAEFVDIFTANQATIDVIPRLKPRYRLGLGSNTNPLHAAHFRRQFAEILGRFDALGLSYEAGIRKPAVDFYRHCAGLVGCPPDQCVFVDDLAVNVAAAEAAGMSAVLYRSDTDLSAELRRHGIEVRA